MLVRVLVRVSPNGQAFNLNMSESKCISAKCVIIIIGVIAAVVIMLALVIHYTATGNDELNFEEGSSTATAKVQKSSGIHLIEMNSMDNEGWSWMEIGLFWLYNSCWWCPILCIIVWSQKSWLKGKLIWK